MPSYLGHAIEAIPNYERASRAGLAADVAGYTRLWEPEFQARGRRPSRRIETIDPTIVFRRGETVKNSGDRFLAVFESPIDALKGTAELQQEIAIQQNRRQL